MIKFWLTGLINGYTNKLQNLCSTVHTSKWSATGVCIRLISGLEKPTLPIVFLSVYQAAGQVKIWMISNVNYHFSLPEAKAQDKVSYCDQSSSLARKLFLKEISPEPLVQISNNFT